MTDSSAPAQKSPEPKKKDSPAATANSSPTPSDTLNKLAHAPADAINKAQDAIAAGRADTQARIDAAAIGEEAPARPAPVTATKQASGPKQPDSSAAATPISPNVTATTPLAAAVEASTSFRSYVANAKVSGVFQGTPARAVINGRLTRVGETVDATLGISFEGVDSERRHLVFKDKTGATVSRRF